MTSLPDLIDPRPHDLGRAPNRVPPERGHGRLRLLLVGLDATGSFCAWVLAVRMVGPGLASDPGRALGTATLWSSATVLLSYSLHLYRARVCAIRSVELTRLVGAALLCCTGAAWLQRYTGWGFSLRVDEIAATTSVLVLGSLRFGYSVWLQTCHVRGLYCRNVCVVGVNEEADALVQLLAGQPELGYHVVAVIGDPALWAGRGSEVPAVHPGPDLAATTRRLGASGVVIATTAVATQELEPTVRRLITSGLHVQMSTGLTRIGHQRMRPSPISHQLLYYVERPSLSPWSRWFKRLIDLVGALVALTLAAPVLALAAVCIKLDDSGPVLFRQERVGQNGKVFKVIKLRTMVPDASARLADVAALNERAGPLFKLSRDPRVTRVGRFLRSTSIDELPQLINVIRGEMSLVGPRPALPEEVQKFDAELLERVTMPPGITGLWQVSARDNPSFHAYRRLDLFYVDNWSVTMDLAILLSTALLVVNRGVRALHGGSEIVTPQPPPPAAVAELNNQLS